MSRRYSAMFARCRDEGKGAFGTFVMLGDPDPETSLAILDALVAGGADMIEAGIPFSDPIADGPVIQSAAVRALAAGITPAACFELLARFRARHADIPIGLLTYANLVVARGLESFCAAVAGAGVDSLLVADAPVMECAPFVAAMEGAGVAPVLIAAPNTPEPVLARIAAIAAPFTYCVARPGVTGADHAPQLDHGALFTALARLGAAPPILGFGISEPDHVHAALDAGAAGAIAGSAIVRLVAANPGREAEVVCAFVAAMKAAA